MRRVLWLLLLIGGGCDRNVDPGYRPEVVPDQHCGDDGAIGVADDGCNRCFCMNNVWTCDRAACRDVCRPGAEKQVSCSRCRCSAERVWVCDRSTCLDRAGPR